jgi:hypothetical protein
MMSCIAAGKASIVVPMRSDAWTSCAQPVGRYLPFENLRADPTEKSEPDFFRDCTM